VTAGNETSMTDLFSLDVLIAVATIVLIIITILMVLVTVRIFLILNAIQKIVTRITEEGERLQAQVAEYREMVGNLGALPYHAYHMILSVITSMLSKPRRKKRERHGAKEN
jgi:hypothetical protein